MNRSLKFSIVITRHCSTTTIPLARAVQRTKTNDENMTKEARFQSSGHNLLLDVMDSHKIFVSLCTMVSLTFDIGIELKVMDNVMKVELAVKH